MPCADLCSASLGLGFVRQDKPHFRITEEEGRGEKACLYRLRDLVSPIRDFIRLARVNENILSPATLLDGHCELNEWNTQEHQLALARREANLSQTRSLVPSADKDAQVLAYCSDGQVDICLCAMQQKAAEWEKLQDRGVRPFAGVPLQSSGSWGSGAIGT
eukprot:s149_g28.t1